MDRNLEALKKIYDELTEIKFWVRLSAIPTIRRAVLDNLRDDVDKIVYELSDGQRSTREIAEIVSRTDRSITHVTVSNMWRRWKAVGLVAPTERRGRYKKVVSLELAGIEMPKVPIVEEI